MALDRVLIKDLAIDGILGINPDERINKQQILVNAELFTDTSKAAQSDNIDDAVNYRTITKAMIAHIEAGEPMLVERLVQELADICLEDERVQKVKISVDAATSHRIARSVGIKITRPRVE